MCVSLRLGLMLLIVHFVFCSVAPSAVHAHSLGRTPPAVITCVCICGCVLCATTAGTVGLTAAYERLQECKCKSGHARCPYDTATTAKLPACRVGAAGLTSGLQRALHWVCTSSLSPVPGAVDGIAPSSTAGDLQVSKRCPGPRSSAHKQHARQHNINQAPPPGPGAHYVAGGVSFGWPRRRSHDYNGAQGRDSGI
ncbi:hypothetical protein C8Q80DRAFT_427525 [Daedaleopsis nitida]|nr:hypothetical protein C8Q80DRAFT_427525 [Daedaleopsis nitida]